MTITRQQLDEALARDMEAREDFGKFVEENGNLAELEAFDLVVEYRRLNRAMIDNHRVYSDLSGKWNSQIIRNSKKSLRELIR